MTKYNLICMSFDGDYVTEQIEADSIEDAWEYSNDMGSKWFFYPFYFVVTESCKTIAEAFYPCEFLNNKRIKTVAKYFKALSECPEAENVNIESFVELCYRNQDYLPYWINQVEV